MKLNKVIPIFCASVALFLTGCAVGGTQPSNSVTPKVTLANPTPLDETKDIEPKTPENPSTPLPLDVADSVAVVPLEKTENPMIEQAKNASVAKPVRFDSCGKPGNYKKSSWFGDFEAAIVQLDKLDPSDTLTLAEMGKTTPEEMLKQYGKVTVADISEICFSEEGHLALAMIAGTYCAKGGILRFDIQDKSIDRAVYSGDVYRCDGNLIGFGKRNGSVIPVKARSGDGGCYSETQFNYDFVENSIRQTRKCSGCNNQKAVCEDSK